jgi:hypothetical protein
MNDYLTKEETDKIYDNLTIIIAPTGGRDSGKIMNDELFYAGINQAIKLWIKKTEQKVLNSKKDKPFIPSMKIPSKLKKNNYYGIHAYIDIHDENIKKLFEITKRQQEEILRLKNKIDPDTKNLIVY